MGVLNKRKKQFKRLIFFAHAVEVHAAVQLIIKLDISKYCV